MKIFNDKDGKLKKLTKIILDIEKEKDTIDWAIASINSCLWNLEGNPKLEMHDREWIVKDLRENLNKKEIAVARLEADDRIKSLKRHLNQKIKQGNKSRHELTRLYQRMHKVNRMSVRTYTYKEGNVYLKQDGLDLVLVFRRAT